MLDDDLCHTVAPEGDDVALCGAVLRDHDWCPSETGGECRHEPCGTCQAVLADEEA